MSQSDWDDAHLINAALAIHVDEPGFGYRFIAEKIEAESGISESERHVWLLCSQQRTCSHFSKKRGLTRKAGPPVHDDPVQRQFTAERANQLWLTDITEQWVDEGKLYLCAIKDLWSNRIVGYSIDFADKRRPRRCGAAERGRPPRYRRDHAALRPRVAVPVEEVR